MSFQDAEATEAEVSGVAEVLRQSLTVPTYGQNPDQIYDNMDSDPLIGPLPEAGRPNCRLALLQRLNPKRTDPANMPDLTVQFCRDNLQQGPEVPADDAAVLGRVQSVQALVNAVTSPSDALSRRNAEALVHDLLGFAGDTDEKLAVQRADLAGKTLSRYQMWCYPASELSEPFREIGSTRGEVVNILGLGYFANNEPNADLVRWAHDRPAATRVCRPTAWDACASPGNVYWRPSGNSCRLDDYQAGVPEVVHAPITVKHLITPIEMVP